MESIWGAPATTAPTPRRGSTPASPQLSRVEPPDYHGFSVGRCRLSAPTWPPRAVALVEPDPGQLVVAIVRSAVGAHRLIGTKNCYCTVVTISVWRLGEGLSITRRDTWQAAHRNAAFGHRWFPGVLGSTVKLWRQQGAAWRSLRQLGGQCGKARRRESSPWGEKPFPSIPIMPTPAGPGPDREVVGVLRRPDILVTCRLSVEQGPDGRRPRRRHRRNWTAAATN